MLCALDLEEPCVTFRPSRPEGLVPPRQPVLLLRPPRWADARLIDGGAEAGFDRQAQSAAAPPPAGGTARVSPATA